jgi:hypothetical protein
VFTARNMVFCVLFQIWDGDNERLILFNKLKYRGYSTVKCDCNALGFKRFEGNLREELP